MAPEKKWRRNVYVALCSVFLVFSAVSSATFLEILFFWKVDVSAVLEKIRRRNVCSVFCNIPTNTYHHIYFSGSFPQIPDQPFQGTATEPLVQKVLSVSAKVYGNIFIEI